MNRAIAEAMPMHCDIQMRFEEFIRAHMMKGGRVVPARAQAALALLERLRDHPSLEMDRHKKPNSAGLTSHETYGKRAHERLGLEPLNTTHGRRSSDLGGWGQALLDALSAEGFRAAKPVDRARILDEAQKQFAHLLRAVLSEEPLEARIRGRSAQAVIADLIAQADARGKSGEVAQYLVGAKLSIRFNGSVPVRPANVADRKSRTDELARTGDFELNSATIEVALGFPDEKHLSQVQAALQDRDREIWILTRQDRVSAWQNELRQMSDVDSARVVVTSVELFVGQNISELSRFASAARTENLGRLFDEYNARWIGVVGTPGLRIVIK